MIDIKQFNENGDDSFRRILQRFYDLIDLLDSNQIIVTKFYKQKKNLVNLYHILESTDDDQIPLGTKLLDLNISDKSISFKDKKNNTIQAQYICIQYFSGYWNDKDRIQRYIFFEFYSIAGILSVLMREKEYRAIKDFTWFDMSQEEWRQAKIQMDVWRQIIRIYPMKIQFTSKSEEYLEGYFDKIYDEYYREESVELPDTNIKSQRQFIKNGSSLILKSWALLSYISMIQVLPTISKSKREFFYLNVICEQFERGIENSLQIILSQLSLRRKSVKTEKISVSSERNVSSVSAITNLPRVIVSDNEKSTISIINSNKANEDNADMKSSKIRSADYFPIIISKQWIIDNNYLDFEINSETIAQLGRDIKLLSDYRNCLDYHLSCRFDDEEIEFFDDYCEDIIRDFKRSRNACRKWWKQNNISMLSEQYIDLFAWFAMTISEDVKYEINSDSNQLLTQIANSIQSYDASLFNVFTTYIELLRIICDIPLTPKEKIPSGESAVNELDYPICDTYTNEPDEVVVFTDKSLSAFVKANAPNIDVSKFVKISRQRELLKLAKNSGNNDNKYPFTFGVKDDGTGRYQKKSYIFKKEKVKLFLTNGVTVEVPEDN